MEKTGKTKFFLLFAVLLIPALLLGCTGNDRYEEELGLKSNPESISGSEKEVGAGAGVDDNDRTETENRKSNEISYPDGLKVEPPSRFDPDALSAVWVEPKFEPVSGAENEITNIPDGEKKLSIPLDMVEKYQIIDFFVNVDGDELPIMAVKTSRGDINIMPRICVPCRSEGWHLKDDVLICDACGTTFDANTGEGISGACKNYPKALISYEIVDGKLIFNTNDAKDAYQKTLSPGWP